MAIDTESKLLLEIDVYSRRGTDPAAAFLRRLAQKHDVSALLKSSKTDMRSALNTRRISGSGKDK